MSATSARWRGCLDPSTNQIYYVDIQTNQSCWDRPVDFQEELLTGGWQRLWDLDQNQPYWYNLQTGMSTWDDPTPEPSTWEKSLDPSHGSETTKKTHFLPKLNATMIPIRPAKNDSITNVVPVSEAKPDPAVVSVQQNFNGSNVTEVPVPVHSEQPAANQFLQQQLKRRSRALSNAAVQQGSSFTTTAGEGADASKPARVVRPLRKSVDLPVDTKNVAPANESSSNLFGSEMATSRQPKPGAARKSTEIKISQVFAKDPTSGDSVDMASLEAEVQPAPVGLVRPHPVRKPPTNDPVQTLDPHDRRGISRRSSSSRESEPTASNIPIVHAPAVKRRPLPVPSVLAGDNSAAATESEITESKQEKDQRLLEQAIAEIVSSEKTYTQSLQILVDVFIERIIREPTLSALMGDARVGMFFSNAEQVASLNHTLLSDLENLVSTEMPSSMPAAIGTIFIRYVNLFSVYTQYARHYGQACEVLQSKNDALEAIFQELQNDPRAQGQSLFSLGIMPIQRIPRYCLLLREVQRKLPEPVSQIDEALIQVEAAASAINEAIRERENREDMLKAAVASKRGAELIKTGHHLLKTGPLSKIDRNGNLKKYTFMLFADQLRYGNRSFSLDGCTIERDPFQLKKKGLHGWVVKTPEKSFMVCAETEGVANEWIQAIEAECMKFRSAGATEILAPVKTNSDLCLVCGTKFSMLHRARHCDLCGKSICQNCYVKVRRNGPKPIRVCHFCRNDDDDEVMDGGVSKSATMTDMGSTYAEEESTIVQDDHPATKQYPAADQIRNHLAAALEELKLKVAVAETTESPPARESDHPIAPEAADAAPPRRGSTRKALDHLAAKISEVRSRTGSRSDLGDVAVDTQARQDLMADVRSWMKHHRKRSSNNSNADNAGSNKNDDKLAGVVQIQAASALPIQGPITSMDQARSRLIDLETMFLQQLGELDKVFARPLLEDMTCAALPSSLAIVFDTVENLQTIHTKLRSTLNEGGDLLQALLMFSELARRPYLVYAKHYGEAVSELDDADLHGRIALCAKVAGITTGAVLVLLKHMARPMQRLPLYISHTERVKELLQQAGSDSGPDYDVICKAHANFHDSWKRMSEIVELRASFETLKSIEAQFDAGGSSGVHLAIPSRVFIRWSMMNKYDRRGRAEHLAFHLFSDVLIYSEKVATGFKLRRQIPLQQCALIREDEQTKYEHGFQLRLVGSSKSLIIAPASEKERHEWVTTINNYIARVLVRKSFRNTDSSSDKSRSAAESARTDIELTFDESRGPTTQGSMNNPETWNEAETWNDTQYGSVAGPERYAMFYEDGAESDRVALSALDPNAIEKHPREVESLWTLYLTEQGEEYFHDSVTGRTTWTKPSKFAVLPQS